MADQNILNTLFTVMGEEGRKKLEDDIKSGNKARIQAAQDKLNAGLQAVAKSANDSVARTLRDMPTFYEQQNTAQRQANQTALDYGAGVEDLLNQKSQRQAQQVIDMTGPLLDKEYGAMERRDNTRTDMYEKQLDYQRGLNNKQLIRDLVLGGMFMFGG